MAGMPRRRLREQLGIDPPAQGESSAAQQRPVYAPPPAYVRTHEPIPSEQLAKVLPDDRELRRRAKAVLLHLAEHGADEKTRVMAANDILAATAQAEKQDAARYDLSQLPTEELVAMKQKASRELHEGMQG